MYIIYQDTHLRYHQDSRSSHPWDGSMLQTWGSYWTHTPDLLCSPHYHHADPHRQDRHSHPLQCHKDCQECSIACRDSSSHCTFPLDKESHWSRSDFKISDLTWWRFLPHPFGYLNHWSILNSWRLLAAVILLMVVMSELLAVVWATHQISSAASVAVIVTSITRTITITLTLVTRVLRSATSSVLH